MTGHTTTDFSGKEIVKVLSNVGNFQHKRTTGSHYIMEWKPPENHENTERRVASIPFKPEIHQDTLREIAENCGAENFKKFCEWIRRNK